MRLAVVLATLCACHGPAISPAMPSAGGPQHDFDFHIGRWTTQLERLVHPLSGSTEWVTYTGTTTVREVWRGKANLVELVADGSAGHLEVLSLRLYDPASHTWTLNVASVRSAEMSPPSTGSFTNGRGEFVSHETLGDRPILVRFVISDITPTSVHFEQAFSADNGATWEVNWVATDTRAQ